jgi:hypothetical protein
MTFRVYFVFSLIIAIAIFISLIVFNCTVRTAYVSAAIIALLGLLNNIAIRFSKSKYPAITAKLFKYSVSIENYKLLFVGLILGSIGLFIITKSKEAPAGYLLLSYGIFFGGFSRFRVKSSKVTLQ